MKETAEAMGAVTPLVKQLSINLKVGGLSPHFYCPQSVLDKTLTPIIIITTCVQRSNSSFPEGTNIVVEMET